MQELTPFSDFITDHHILTLATSLYDEPYCATLFYVFDEARVCFVVASDEETHHMQNALQNPHIAGTIALETKTVGKIQGLQFQGGIEYSNAEHDAALYFRAYPYARVMQPTFWLLHVKSMKLTDNRLGFGKKLNWPDASE